MHNCGQIVFHIRVFHIRTVVTVWRLASQLSMGAAFTPAAKPGDTTLPRLPHAQAFGVALTGERGWSLVFSGDTRPCAAVTAAAKDATMLIHEVRP